VECCHGPNINRQSQHPSIRSASKCAVLVKCSKSQSFQEARNWLWNKHEPYFKKSGNTSSYTSSMDIALMYVKSQKHMHLCARARAHTHTRTHTHEINITLLYLRTLIVANISRVKWFLKKSITWISLVRWTWMEPLLLT